MRIPTLIQDFCTPHPIRGALGGISSKENFWVFGASVVPESPLQDNLPVRLLVGLIRLGSHHAQEEDVLALNLYFVAELVAPTFADVELGVFR